MRIMSTRGLLLRGSLVTAIVALGLVVGLGGSGQGARAGQGRAAAHSAAAPACDQRRIRGVTDNRTGIPAQLLSEGYSLGNYWCHEPAGDVHAHASNQWAIGEKSGPISLHLLYRLKNGDEISFVAQLRKPEGIETGCSFRQVVRTPREYECSAEVSASGRDVAFVKFLILVRPK
jgi:hypothetical protein